MHNRMSRVTWVLFGAVVAGQTAAARAAFLDLRTVTPNLVGGDFTGFLDGVSVSGTASGSDFYAINGPGTNYIDSTINGTSPQYSYASVYDPAASAVDQVGYSAFSGSIARISITFGSPVTNLRFHVADLDRAIYAFALTNGLTSVSLVRGNGGDGDGLQVIDNVVSDANPATAGGLATTTPPPLTGPRSAFGTISLNGTFTVLVVDMRASGVAGVFGGSGGSFTLSSVPEPTTMAVVGVGGLALLRRRRLTT